MNKKSNPWENLFIRSEQPTTCPNCGSRTEIVSDMCYLIMIDQPMIHKCLNFSCKFEFVEVNEEDCIDLGDNHLIHLWL